MLYTWSVFVALTWIAFRVRDCLVNMFDSGKSSFYQSRFCNSEPNLMNKVGGSSWVALIQTVKNLNKLNQSDCFFFSDLNWLFKKVFWFIFKRESMGRRGAEREGTGGLKQALHWQQWARRGPQTHEPWDHDLSWSWTLNQGNHPSTPDTGFWKQWYE